MNCIKRITTMDLFATSLLMTLTCGLLYSPSANAQTIEYTVTDLPTASGAFNTIPVAINDQGEVVGWAQFSGGEFFLRAWRWSADEGLTLLQAPPGAMSDRYGAEDINNLGVIAGDGGFDSGQAWRFENGSYTIVDALPGLDGSRRSAINNFGDLVATAFDSQSFTTPTRALLFTDEEGALELFPDDPGSQVGDINDVGQIAAKAGGSPVRVEPDGFETILPVPAGFVGFTPARINAAGDIAGIAGCTHECNQAFLWTEESGFLAIPPAGVRMSLGGMNDQQEVVGGVEEGTTVGWIWSQEEGLRLLADLIDPELTRNIYSANDINNVGQIITYGADFSDPLDGFRIMLLTPIVESNPEDVNGDGVVNVSDLLDLLAAWGSCPGCPEDINGNGTVDIVDLLLLLGNWS